MGDLFSLNIQDLGQCNHVCMKSVDVMTNCILVHQNVFNLICQLTFSWRGLFF